MTGENRVATGPSLSTMTRKVGTPRTRIATRFGVIPTPLYTRSECACDCIYCPSADRVPRSYLANEDTVRAIVSGYSARVQMRHWIERIHKELAPGGPMKLEVIVIGGTFCDLDYDYRRRFIKDVYDELNGFIAVDLADAQEAQEKAFFRACVVTVETRPDTITPAECEDLLSLGVTRVELGVQSLYDDVLSFAGRPYTYETVVRSVQLLREYGFKVGLHVMLNMPGSDIERDKQMLALINENANLRPDCLKIYPLSLLRRRSAQPHMWRLLSDGRWEPYEPKTIATMLADFKAVIHPTIRIQRIQRQFGMQDMVYGNVQLRNLVFEEMRRRGTECRCLRCQEIAAARAGLDVVGSWGDVRIECDDVSKDERFITARIGPNLLGYARVHTGSQCVVREIKVLGRSSEVGSRGQIQGNGVGTALMYGAERLARDQGYDEVLLNAGVGVRGFFRKLGYSASSAYMRKYLSSVRGPAS